MLMNDQKRGRAYERNKKHMDQKGSHSRANKSRDRRTRRYLNPKWFPTIE